MGMNWVTFRRLDTCAILKYAGNQRVNEKRQVPAGLNS